ncbi:hypothetical protein GN956_G20374 [Arapaima gigas]
MSCVFIVALHKHLLTLVVEDNSLNLIGSLSRLHLHQPTRLELLADMLKRQHFYRHTREEEAIYPNSSRCGAFLLPAASLPSVRCRTEGRR